MMKISLRHMGLAAVASGALALTLAAPAFASVQGSSTQSSSGYHFRTLNDHRDVTFNQLLGINNEGVIAGYFGSGAQGHPNKGYRAVPAVRAEPSPTSSTRTSPAPCRRRSSASTTRTSPSVSSPP